MRGTSRTIIALLVTLGALAGLGCGGEAPGPEQEAPALRIHVAGQDERVLGPLGMYWFLTFLPLTADLDVDGAYEPRLLSSWEHSPDYSEWTLNVREQLRWGDGEPVTAEDVKYSLELWTDPDVGYEYRFFDTLEILDSHTLRMAFPEPPPATLHTYSWLAIVPEHLLADNAPEDIYSWPFWVEPVGNGPFRYVRHVPKVMTELEANPDYYGDPPAIQKVVLRYGGKALTELLAGNVDVASGITPMEALRLAGDPRFRLYFGPVNLQVGIAWNHRIPLFREAAVRRALTMSIDRREMLQLIGHPEDTPIVDVPAKARHYAAGPEALPDPLPFAPEGARRLLARAGWVDTDGDDVRERDGRELRFELLATEARRAEAVFIQDALAAVGVAVRIKMAERTVLRDWMRAHEFDAAVRQFNYIEGYDDFPTTGYRNPDVSRLRDRAWFSIDPDTVDTYVRELWEIVGREIPITYLYPQRRIIAAHRRVRGMRDHRELSAFVEHLWIEEEAGGS